MNLNTLNNIMNIKKTGLKIGDKVKYTSGTFGDYPPNNPLWEGKSGKKIGTIQSIEPKNMTLPFFIKWGPGIGSYYGSCDIEKIQ